jgi:prepilin-type N-terminal cleavage/methylation domain-containing protein
VRRGFSLVELMVVVGIVGLMAAMSAYALSSVNELGRINGNADVFANILRTARTRAITERCTYVVQMNGVNFAPTVADVPRKPGTVLLWRKNNCQSTVGAYEGALPPAQRDRLVNDYATREFSTTLFFSPTITTEAGDQLLVGSVSIAWQPDGTRTVWFDADGDGTSALSPYTPTLPFTITVRSATATPTPNRRVVVPPDGPAVVQ